MRALRILILLVFLPAGLGLLIQAADPALSLTVSHISGAQRLLSLSLALFCPELAHMAIVDLNNIAAVAELQEDSRLRHFSKVTVSTVVLEAVGFYAALVSLQWGVIAIIFSQLWFNLLAGIQLWPGQSPPITPHGISDRRAVLIANGLGLGLISLWPLQAVRIWLAAGLFTLITLFLVIKYGWQKVEQAR
ncbi:hypothetical protein [Leptolyngbya sp. BC1307]|uniref:hypothetical protein n=1 Tax=Leptolyngbya sp. BC1307 TaxID=2029589 RepID=UPI000EFB18C1|nr:hypothetical protein [Leptolyngbya sp. BC1307]